ncbi:hypothetical protein GOBAR_AA36689 [Gossypium barbadense]|uniref:Uncharacterized protein n=1 Tax=Gossypium barbadense TaxID=3634 RepID=A0A2P5QVB8_GOSBA|nr:hypothetical protein GOBAR_DD24602 [Gossypium barbadense]PPR84017.1 hypothetical protein GOBAR_AA36689 [Gossypium barbadense]
MQCNQLKKGAVKKIFDSSTLLSLLPERKKGSNSEKPKQPQRGLGVAQLEKIRLQGPVGCTYHHHPSLHGRPFPSNFNQEDMRVQTLYSSMASSPSSSSSTTSASYGFHPTMMKGLGEYDKRPNTRYGDFQSCTTTSWNPDNGSTQHFAQPNLTRQLLNLHHVEVDNSHPYHDSPPKKSKKQGSNSLGSSSQNCESTQELDLELRLSL